MNHASITPAIIVLLSHALIYTASDFHRASPRIGQNSIRIAIVGFAGPKADDSLRIDTTLTDALGRDSRVVLIEQSLVKPVIAGVGYDRSINMSKDEARRLGAAIGCDFFIIGKTEANARSTRENESHEEAYAGVMIVDARTGSLAVFDFIVAKAGTRDGALSALANSLSVKASGYTDRIATSPASTRNLARQPTRATGDERIEDIPDDGSPRAVGFSNPQFLNRVKPDYTAEAEQADITATVEAKVVFRSSGEVGNIDIIRWAGFGLDESAERAIHQLKFKPATREGKPVSARALIRYNFRRITEPERKPEQPAKPRTMNVSAKTRPISVIRGLFLSVDRPRMKRI